MIHPQEHRRPSHQLGGKNQEGMVMVMAVMMLTVVLLLAISAAITSTSETRLTGHDYQESQAFYLAEGYTNFGVDALNTTLHMNMDPTQAVLSRIQPPSVPSGYTLDNFSIQKVSGTRTRTISHGAFKGMDASTQSFMVTSEVSRSEESAIITQEVEHQSISAYEFYIFFDQDIELYFHRPMRFGGRVHSNGNIYLGTHQGMTFDGPVTAVGHIYHHQKGGGQMSPPGDINIIDFWGNYQNMLQDHCWLDATCANWETEAIDRWGGTVMDSSHNVEPLWYLLPYSFPDQIELIKRGQPGDSPELREARYYYHAGVRVLDGVAYDSSGVPISMGTGTLGSDFFYDHREGMIMNLIELDIDAMINNGTYPSNGIIYISGSLYGDAVRLINAETLPPDGLTVVSDNPVYIYGNYNISPKRPASVLADAVTVLSADFDDDKTFHGKVNQQACETWVNTCIMSGSQETIWYGGQGGNYNGGLDTMIRFLERWSNVWLHYRGSLISLWRSEQATGQWHHGSNFSPPIRDWGYDPDLLGGGNQPPGAPMMHTIQIGTWRQIG